MSYRKASRKNPSLQHPDDAEMSFERDNVERSQRINFNNEELPEIEDWNTGEEYEVKLKVKFNKKMEGTNNEQVGWFDITAVSAMEKEIPDETPEQKRVKKIIG